MPREAVEAALRLLAAELADEGFALGTGLILRSRQGDTTRIIRTQTSKWNRSGVQARFELSAWFESDELAAFRKLRSPNRPASVMKFDRLVTTRKLRFPGSPRHAEWDVLDTAVRPAVAMEALAIIRADILPWFEKMRNPVEALAELLDGSIHSSLIAYAVATGYADAARTRIAALAIDKPQFGEVLDRLRREGKPAAFRSPLEQIAWTAIDCDVA
jgi:hypothetical protein